jgi:hypothetical protein
LTQRHATEVEETDTEQVKEESAEVTPEPVHEEVEPVAALQMESNSEPSVVAEVAEPAEAHTEQVQVEAAQSEPAAAEIAPHEEVHTEPVNPEVVPGENERSAPEESGAEPERTVRRSWRERVSKIFSAAQEEANAHEQPVGEQKAEEKAAAETAQTAKPPVSGESQFGSFVIEGGHVEHEELDEEETEMPALAAHFDRYEESEIDEDTIEDGNGSQFGAAVRESGEENALEDAEYDFGSEEFEESELVAEESDEEED